MIVTHNITMDLVRRDVTPKIDVVQDDKYSRDLEVALMENGVPVDVPQSSKVMILFEKADGKGGAYDTMPDGAKAWSIKGNRVTVKLAPQVCTAAGKAALTFVLLDEESELSSFAVEIWVQKRPGLQKTSENYTMVCGFLPQPVQAKPGQFLRVAQVDGQGHVIGVNAVGLAAKARPGQAVVIKEVDKNGVPIQWDAGDIPNDEHIQWLINNTLGVIENGAY